jgi:rhodanese-related sulfurtransferase
VKSVFLEALLVATIGGTIAFAANSLSPAGLKLTRNYFPPLTPGPTNAVLQVVGTNQPANAAALLTRVQQLGFSLLNHEEVVELHRSPEFQQNLLLFVDARDSEHYQRGHIPGAVQFDYYRPEQHLAEVLPLCQLANRIVVYCEGGDCEDSLLAAVFLRDAQVPAQKLAIYEGGYSCWQTNGMPIELGTRNSGLLKEREKVP